MSGVIYKPSPWQTEFHSLTVWEALGGGAAGPGKSFALLMDPLQQIVTQHKRCSAGEFEWGRAPGWALHARKEFPRLEETIERATGLFKAIDDGVRWEGNSHRFTFSSGYKFSFGHLKDKDSYLNYRSKEFTHLGFDEIGELEDKNTYDQLVSRVRSTDPVLRTMLKVRSCTNPSGNWVREYFVDPNPAGREVLRKKVTLSDGSVRYRTRLFLPAKLSDNPDPNFRLDYEATLRGLPSHIQKALLDGDWYVIPGAFFADVWDSSRLVIKPFNIPSGWRRFRSADWGYKEECVILWWAVSPEKELICYRERTYNGTKAKRRLDAGEVARAIREVEKANGEWNTMRNESRLTGVMDNQLWEERGRKGPTMADDMAREGVFWKKATKGRISMAQQFISRAGQRGYNGRPGIMFFDTCSGCIATIPTIKTDETDPEKPADGGKDHWWAAVGYACAYNAQPSGKEDRVRDDDEFEDRPTSRRDEHFGFYGGRW